MGPRVLWWLLFVSVCVQLAHGPTGSVVAVVSVCVCAADPWDHRAVRERPSHVLAFRLAAF